MPMPDEIYGITVSVPEEFSDRLMDAIDSAMEPLCPGYSRCFAMIPCKGTWRTEEGAHPFNGRIGEITTADEVRIKFVCRKKDLAAVLKAIDEVHPYEEPAVDVVPQIAWRSLIQRSSPRVWVKMPSKVF